MIDRSRCYSAFADMTNSQIAVCDPVDETLCNNLPVMAVTPTMSPFLCGDETIVAATLAALETGTLTPLIKEELKCSILTRRLVEGKDDIVVDFSVPDKKELTKEEEERMVVRRGQNRLAARRFRKKQKDTESSLLQKTRRLETMNTQLRGEVLQLRTAKEELRALLDSHLLVCPIGLTPAVKAPIP